MYSAVMNLGVGSGSSGGWCLDRGGGGGAIVLFWPDSEGERSVDSTFSDCPGFIDTER